MKDICLVSISFHPGYDPRGALKYEYPGCTGHRKLGLELSRWGARPGCPLAFRTDGHLCEFEA